MRKLIFQALTPSMIQMIRHSKLGYVPICSSLIVSIGCLAIPAWSQQSSGTAETTKEYMTVSKMGCAQTEVIVQTYCEELADMGAGCFLQKVEFRNLADSKKYTKLYAYENFKNDMSLIVALLCVRKKSGSAIVFQSSNLGNCKMCEWEDYYDNKGQLLGSTRSKFGPTNIAKKRLPNNFYENNGFLLDGSGKFIEIRNIFISRKQP